MATFLCMQSCIICQCVCACICGWGRVNLSVSCECVRVCMPPCIDSESLWISATGVMNSGESSFSPSGYAQPVFPPHARLEERQYMAHYPLLQEWVNNQLGLHWIRIKPRQATCSYLGKVWNDSKQMMKNDNSIGDVTLIYPSVQTLAQHRADRLHQPVPYKEAKTGQPTDKWPQKLLSNKQQDWQCWQDWQGW